MNAYIYQADLLCQDCAIKTMRVLDKAGKRPADPDDDNSFDSDDYPKSAGPDGGGESDCPQHCGDCHCPLENELTNDGVNYVLNALFEEVIEGREQARMLCDERTPYYKGAPHAAIVLDWAEQLGNYNLESDEAGRLAALSEVLQEWIR